VSLYSSSVARVSAVFSFIGAFGIAVDLLELSLVVMEETGIMMT
jgi:hypothetical protein